MIKLQDLLLEQEDVSIPLTTIKSLHSYADSNGMKISQKNRFRKKLIKKTRSFTHEYASVTLNYLPIETRYSEILSAQAIANAYPNSTDWRTKPPNYQNLAKTLHVIARIKKIYGGPIQLTGGDDAYHRVLGYESDHTKGYSIDFVARKSDNDQRQVEDAVAQFIVENPDVNVTYINEYKKPSKKASGDHHHISINPSSTDGCYFHFITDKDGNNLRGTAANVQQKLNEIVDVFYGEKKYKDIEPVIIKIDKPHWVDKFMKKLKSI